MAKGRLLLTVEVKTKEDVDGLLRWLYTKETPMTSSLLEIAWDKVAVPKKEAEAIQFLKETLLNP